MPIISPSSQGGASIATFGPYRVTYQSPGVTTNGFPLHTFPAGTVLWGGFSVPLIQFAPVDNGIAIQDDANTVAWLSFNTTVPSFDGVFRYGTASWTQSTPSAVLPVATTVAAWANPFGGPFSAGSVDLYILASVP